MSDVMSTSATTLPVTLAQMKSHLNVSTTYDDSYITDLIAAATRYTEDKCNQCWITQTRTLKMQGFYDKRYVRYIDETSWEAIPRYTVVLPRGPVSSVTSVAYITSTGGSTTMPSSDYSVSGDNPGRIAEAYNATWPDTRSQQDSVTITYVAGHGSTQSSVPETVRHAIKMVAGHWYRNREAVMVGTITKDIEHGVDALLGHQTRETYG